MEEDQKLNDMKNVWQNSPAAAPLYEESELAQIIRRRSGEIVRKFNSYFMFEIALNIGLIGLIAWYFLGRAANREAMLMGLLLVFLLMPIFIFYVLGFRQLREVFREGETVRASLQRTLDYWQQAISLYFWIPMSIMPAIYIGLNLFKVLQHAPDDRAASLDFSWTGFLLGALVFCVATGGLTWLLIQKTYYKLFVNKIKQCLEELDR